LGEFRRFFKEKSILIFMKKSKILAIGDIHGNSTLMRKLAKQAVEENIDLVILAGDLTFAETETRGIIKPFIDAKKQVLLIPGNHESFETADFLAQLYYPTKNIHGYSFVKDDLGVFGAGGAENMPGFPGLITEKDLFDTLERAHSSLKGIDRKLMVTHMHARGTKSEFSGFEGSNAVRKAIEKFQPDVAIFAHIHEAAGTEDKIGKTRVINVSKKGKIFEV